MAAFARGHGVRLRPHAKMHKSAAIARLQIAAGAVGVCVQKTSEAEALAGGGHRRHLHPNEVDRPEPSSPASPRWRGASGWRSPSIRPTASSGWPRRCARPAATIDVFVEIDVGQGRCGVPPAAAGALAHRVVSHRRPRAACASPACRPTTARAQHLRGGAEREAAIAPRGSAGASGAGQRHRARASPARSSPARGTGTFVFDTASGVWGELQAGSYLFMDRDYADNAPTPGRAALRARAVRQEPGDEPRRRARGDRRRPQVACDRFRACRASGGRELDFANGGDEHGILRPRPGASAAALPALGDDGLAGARPLRPDREPARPLRRRARRARPTASSRPSGRSTRAAASSRPCSHDGKDHAGVAQAPRIRACPRRPTSRSATTAGAGPASPPVPTCARSRCRSGPISIRSSRCRPPSAGDSWRAGDRA